MIYVELKTLHLIKIDVDTLIPISYCNVVDAPDNKQFKQ